MKSPFTGREMSVQFITSSWKFRGEEFPYTKTQWVCDGTQEIFTTDESDTAGFMQVTNQYRNKYGIPYTDEIISIRQKYGISASKMSVILGIGINQYRLYEQGEVPNVSNGRMIRSLNNPMVMREMVESAKNLLSGKEYHKINTQIDQLIQKKEEFRIQAYEIKRIFDQPRGKSNGYAPISLSRLQNTLLYLINKCNRVWCTKMNKLLFYLDFLSYRELGHSISGLSYKAIEFGPVPVRWDKIYSEFSAVSCELSSLGEHVGTLLVAHELPNTEGFTAAELKILERVCEKFGNMSSTELSKLSHEEVAWQDFYQKNTFISFDTAFLLKNI